MSNFRLKFGILDVKKGRSVGVYAEGVVDIEKIKNEIIPCIEEKNIDFPIIIYAYYSQDLPSKKGFEIIESRRDRRFKPKKPKQGTKSYEWFIDENRNVYKMELRERAHAREA